MKFATILLSILLCQASLAATTGTLLLKGTVPRLLELTVTPTTLATTLPLSTTQTNSVVASVQEKSNALLGYTVNISSANLGKLVHQSITTSVINYVLKYNSQTVNLAAGQGFSELTRGVKNRSIEVSYTGVPEIDLIEGDYTDTVTFTMVAN